MAFVRTRTVPEIFVCNGPTKKAFEELLSFADTLGQVQFEEKKTCAHLAAGKAAFVGIHPRKAGLRLTLVLSRPLQGDRILKCDKASAKRYYIEVNVIAENGIDDELKSWIEEAYLRNM